MPTPLEEFDSLRSKAQRAGVPLYQFLGGPTRYRVRVLSPFSGEEVAATARRWFLVDHGQASPAPAQWNNTGLDFALRAPRSLKAAAAVAFAKSLQVHSPLWFSHPDAATLRTVSRSTTVPVAADSSQIELLKEETADLLLLDLPALGIARVQALAVLAETHYAGVALTGCRQSPWREAGLHLAAALPNFLAIETSGVPLDAEGYAELPR